MFSICCPPASRSNNNVIESNEETTVSVINAPEAPAAIATMVVREEVVEVTGKPGPSNAEMIVREAWESIESNDQIPVSEEKIGLEDGVGWKTIRVFVSSTFTDMHSEREMLVKKVFTELREWCEEKQFTLVECDLRWGVPKDSPSNKTISVCLEELDRCTEENCGYPFFISMLSERYGWVPSDSEVSEEIKHRYKWVPNISITHMEILHGAYRMNNPNAIFCFRDSDFVPDIPQHHLAKFIEKEDLPNIHLRVLKEKLKKKFSDQFFTYKCNVSGVDMSTGREKVKLTGLEEFADKILNFLKKAISRQYPPREESSEPTEDQQDDSVHMRNVYLRSNFVIGRGIEMKSVIDYVREGQVSNICVPHKPDSADEEAVEKFDKHLMDECEKHGVEKNENRILCLSGNPGIGKSTLMCKTAETYIKEGGKVFFHYVGCTSSSHDWKALVRRLIIFFDSTALQTSDDLSEEDLVGSLKKSIQNIKKHVAVFICGVEKLDNNSHTLCLDWLPPRLPDNIRCIVSVDCNHFICMDRLQSKGCYFLRLNAFPRDEAVLFVEKYLEQFNKKLDDDQLQDLLQHESAHFPLWLTVACEELRIFGDFATLSKKIKSFPADMKYLFQEVLNRLLSEDETNAMEKLLCLILCSHSGLPEKEILKMLGDPAAGIELPTVVWATLRRHLKPFIMQFKFFKTSKVKLMHTIFYEAAKELLLNENKSTEWHTYLADYYEFHNNDEVFVTDDLAHNLFHAGLWKRLATFYKTNERTFNMNAYMRSQILSKIRCQQYLPPNMPMSSFEVIVCMTCSFRARESSVLPHQRKDVCQICGNWVAFKKPENVANMCRLHTNYPSSNFRKCFFCGMAQMLPQQLVFMHLCHNCSFGRVQKMCCHLFEQPN